MQLKALYNLRYYARRRGYLIDNKTMVYTVPEFNRSPRVEERLAAAGYATQLNLFADFVRRPSSDLNKSLSLSTPSPNRGGVNPTGKFVNLLPVTQ